MVVEKTRKGPVLFPEESFGEALGGVPLRTRRFFDFAAPPMTGNFTSIKPGRMKLPALAAAKSAKPSYRPAGNTAWASLRIHRKRTGALPVFPENPGPRGRISWASGGDLPSTPIARRLPGPRRPPGPPRFRRRTRCLLPPAFSRHCTTQGARVGRPQAFPAAVFSCPPP